MEPTEVYDTYWRFAAERQQVYFRRLTSEVGPWTNDHIIRAYRFTNAYRASDRVSQYLIREVQYRDDRPQSPPELFFRTMLFKIFNKIETWKAIESDLGPVTWRKPVLERISRVLDGIRGTGVPIYSAAYIMPSPQLGRERKHENHLALLCQMMEDRVAQRIVQAPTLATVYEMLLRYPGIGSFLAFQYAIDLNYSAMLDFSEADFVVAGPGAIDGIDKCFRDARGLSAAEVIHRVVEDQHHAFSRLGLKFRDLHGRPLQPIDCQNLFCEISKYARIAHPEYKGITGRTRIKQSYRTNTASMSEPMFPPRWKLDMVDRDEHAPSALPSRPRREEQRATLV